MLKKLVLTVLLVVMCAGTIMAAQNLLKNGSFEALNDKNLPADWTYGQHRGETEIFVDDQDVKEGRYALRIDGFTGDAHAQIQQLVDAKVMPPGDVYRFTMWYKSRRMEYSTRKEPFNVPVVVRLRFKDETGAYINATEDQIKSSKQPQHVVYYNNLHFGATKLSNDEWSLFQVDFLAPKNMASVWVEVFLWNNPGMLWLDDLQLTRVGAD